MRKNVTGTSPSESRMCLFINVQSLSLGRNLRDIDVARTRLETKRLQNVTNILKIKFWPFDEFPNPCNILGYALFNKDYLILKRRERKHRRDGVVLKSVRFVVGKPGVHSLSRVMPIDLEMVFPAWRSA